MKVWGFMTSTRAPPKRRILYAALNFTLLSFTPCFSASRSTVRKPILCRVFAYFSPGLPSPARIQSAPEERFSNSIAKVSLLFSVRLRRLCAGPESPTGRESCLSRLAET